MTERPKPKERQFIHRWRSAVVNSKLTSTAKMVLLVLAEYSNVEGDDCRPSLGSVAELASVNEKTARRMLAEAASGGWISRWHKQTGRDWRYWEYRLELPEAADTTPARWRKAADTVPAPYPEAADTTPAPLGATCGHSVPEVRTLTSRGAGTVSNEIGRALDSESEIGKAQALALSTDNAVPADRFDEFWFSYPRKIGDKKAARRHWVKHRLDRLADVILLEVNERTANDPRWADLQFVPHPTTYLRGERWNDEWRPSKKPSGQMRPTSFGPDAEAESAADVQAALKLIGVVR